MPTNQVESISVPSSASIHEKNAMKAFASVWQIKTGGETAFFQSEEVIFFNIIMIVISTITIVIKTEQNAFTFCLSLLPKCPVRR